MDSKSYDAGFKVGRRNGKRQPPKKYCKTHLKFDSWDRGWLDGKREHSKHARCICTRVCDCQSPDTNPAGVSNECPEHNMMPYPNPSCEVNLHWFEK